MKKFISAYEKIEDIVAAVGMIFGVGIIFVGVVMRYAFNHPLSFPDEIAPIFIVWSTLVGYSIALRKDEHIKMDILYVSLKSEKIRKTMDLFSYVCGILFSMFMTVYGFKAMQMQLKMNRVTQILEVPVWITYLIIPFIGVVLTARYVYLIVTQLKKPETEPQATDVAEEKEG